VLPSLLDLDSSSTHDHFTRLQRRLGAMNPDIKLVLDTMSKHFEDQDARWEKRFTEHDEKWERKFLETDTAQDVRVSQIERAVDALEQWRPEIEGSVDDLHLEVKKLNKYYEHATIDYPVEAPLLPTTPLLPAGRTSASASTHWPNGHRISTNAREDGFGSVTTIVHPPAKGTCDRPPSRSRVPPSENLLRETPPLRGSRGAPGSTGRMAKLNFPSFDGNNPKLWLYRCKSYFEMCSLESSIWIPLAAMHMNGPAARWFQSVEEKLRSASWSEFSQLLLDRFGREQKELLIRQLFHIRQSGSVADYVSQFSELLDQLVAYGHVTDPIYYAMRFLDGLRADIKTTVSLHCPTTFDTAASLALLQEDVSVAAKGFDSRRESFSSVKPTAKGPHPLPAPPMASNKQAQPILPEETRLCEGKSPAERWSALQAFRRAKGLCVRYADKWSRDHKCAPSVQLHVLQEMLKLFSLEESTQLPIDSDQQDQLFMALSQAAVTGNDGPKTLRLKGSLQGHPVLILVDSRNSHTFVSQHLAFSHLSGIQSLQSSIQVKVANGHIISRDSWIAQAKWEVDEYFFSTGMRILPLHHFDVILGMDWLEAHSPMKVDWKSKWLAVPYKNSTAVLQGILPAVPEEVIVHLCSLPSLAATPAVSLSPEVEAIIQQFSLVFEPLSSLPPERSCDHAIPLVPGAKVVSIRPYRYPPALKDEIERQVADMLAKGIIQPS